MRVVVNVSTGRYLKGQDRLLEEVTRQGFEYMHWRDKLPGGCPAHADVPYAFKAYALKQAVEEGYTTLLWADASINPVRSLRPLFERIERDGYWIGNNGWTNYEWTADSAYLDLFHGEGQTEEERISHYRLVNRGIPHVVAGAFGLNVAHPIGKGILDEYYRLASTTKAFCGPWTNLAQHPQAGFALRAGHCGPADVRGHRHDQTALSVLAWRFGCRLTNSPEILAYKPKDGESIDERTILLMDGIC